MGMPSAKKGDRVVGIDTHIVMVPSPAGPVPTPMPLPFNGELRRDLAATISIDNQAAATEGSVAENVAKHVAPGGTFQKEPSNEGVIQGGSATVIFDGQKAARALDVVRTCYDPADAPTGIVQAVATVFVGD
jgi:uncharacterized Zn-binding protein involved in type VI secretion